MLFTKKTISFFTVILISAFAAAQTSYYAPIDGVEGGAALKTALHNLIKSHVRIEYGSGAASTWGAFYTTDRNPQTNEVYDMYSSTVRYFGDRGVAVTDMNIEHSVAKSWWGGDVNDAYCDLHHLNPSDKTANNRKSNFPMAELEDVTWNNGVTFVGKATIEGSLENAYEPCDEYKGDFARTFMYMFTCYQDFTFKYTYMNYENSAYPTFKPWAVEMLLKWHKQDPVSAKEIARNDAVYSIQGNRNPYIDYPALADYVWGDSVGCLFHIGDTIIGNGGGINSPKTFVMEAFSSSLGSFAVQNTLGDYAWTNKYGSAHISAYESSTYTNYAAESWLVSPSMDFSWESAVDISFDYITKYNQNASVVPLYNQLLISDDYSGDVATATWQAIDFSIVQNSDDWTFTSTGNVALPSEYMGKENVTLAFKYTSTEKKAGTFRVKNLVVSRNVAAGDDDTTNDDTTNDDDGSNGNNGSVGNNGNYPFEYFTLVADASTLTVGDSVIIVYEDNVMGAQSGKYRERLAGAVIESDKIISYPEGTQKAVLVAGTVDGSYGFKVDGLYLSAQSSSSNNLYSMQELSDNASWDITITDGAAVIVSKGSYTRNTLQYNPSSPRFSCYAGTQKSPSIYAKSPVSTTAVENVVAERDVLVNVYNMQGVCVRAVVNAASALDALPRGFYIVEGRKIYNE